MGLGTVSGLSQLDLPELRLKILTVSEQRNSGLSVTKTRFSRLRRAFYIPYSSSFRPPAAGLLQPLFPKLSPKKPLFPKLSEGPPTPGRGWLSVKADLCAQNFGDQTPMLTLTLTGLRPAKKPAEDRVNFYLACLRQGKIFTLRGFPGPDLKS